MRSYGDRMTAYRAPLRRRARLLPPLTRASLPRAGAALATVCGLCVLTVLPAAAAPAAAPGDGEGSAGSSSSSLSAGGALLSEPGVHARPDADTPDVPSGITALSWLVSDARTGQVLAAKDAHRRLPPASTLKTLFADTVMPRLPRDEQHKVTDADLAGIGQGSSLVGVQTGQTYSVADLWRGVFLASGNDAVHVLAHMNGGVDVTVREMQAKARMLGAYDTHVVSPDGYDQPGQVSSAYDLAVFARAGLRNPDFADYCSTKDAQFPGGYDAHGMYVSSFGIQNTNRLLSGAKGVTPYPGMVGVKNGYTTNAGNTLVAAAQRDGRTLIVTVMNPQSGVPNAVYTEARKLLDWGFSAAGRTTSVGTLNASHTTTDADGGDTAGTAPKAADATQAGKAAGDGQAHPAAGAKSAADKVRSVEPTSAGTTVASPTAWYIGGGLAVVAAVSVLVLRRRNGGTKGE